MSSAWIPGHITDEGTPVSGAKVYVYDGGTTTPATPYTDAGLTVAATNPVIADSDGRFQFFVDAANDATYDFKVTDSGGGTVYRYAKNVPAVEGSSYFLFNFEDASIIADNLDIIETCADSIDYIEDAPSYAATAEGAADRAEDAAADAASFTLEQIGEQTPETGSASGGNFYVHDQLIAAPSERIMLNVWAAGPGVVTVIEMTPDTTMGVGTVLTPVAGQNYEVLLVAGKNKINVVFPNRTTVGNVLAALIPGGSPDAAIAYVSDTPTTATFIETVSTSFDPESDTVTLTTEDTSVIRQFGFEMHPASASTDYTDIEFTTGISAGGLGSGRRMQACKQYRMPWDGDATEYNVITHIDTRVRLVVIDADGSTWKQRSDWEDRTAGDTTPIPVDLYVGEGDYIGIASEDLNAIDYESGAALKTSHWRATTIDGTIDENNFSVYRINYSVKVKKRIQSGMKVIRMVDTNQGTLDSDVWFVEKT
jgi:hypothetical protein